MTDFGKRLLPHDASLTDDPADVGTSTYPTVDTADLVQGLVDRSGNPRGMMTPRYGSDGLCSTCQLPPHRPAPTQEGHEYLPMIGRTPGVSQDVDWNRTQNSPDDVGQVQTVNDDPALDSADARFRQASSRWVPYQPGEGPFPVL